MSGREPREHVVQGTHEHALGFQAHVRRAVADAVGRWKEEAMRSVPAVLRHRVVHSVRGGTHTLAVRGHLVATFEAAWVGDEVVLTAGGPGSAGAGRPLSSG